MTIVSHRRKRDVPFLSTVPPCHSKFGRARTAGWGEHSQQSQCQFERPIHWSYPVSTALDVTVVCGREGDFSSKAVTCASDQKRRFGSRSLTSGLPLLAGSTGRRNTSVKSLRRCFKLQGLTWSFV